MGVVAVDFAGITHVEGQRADVALCGLSGGANPACRTQKLHVVEAESSLGVRIQCGEK